MLYFFQLFRQFTFTNLRGNYHKISVKLTGNTPVNNLVKFKSRDQFCDVHFSQ